MNLEELGLSTNESKAYESLIKLGSSGASQISKNSGVPYGRVYNVLDSLVSKGLVKIVPGKNKLFVPSDPENLSKIVEEKEKNLLKIKDEIKALDKFYQVKEKNPVTMVFGKKGFHKLVDEMGEPEKYTYVVKWTSEFNPKWVEATKKIKSKKIEKKTLVRYDDETKSDVRKWMKYISGMRKINNEGVAMSISDDDEVMVGLVKSNVTLLIRDESFAKIMKEFFLRYYERAEEIK